MQDYKYFAFISYSSKDTDWGKQVQRKLEHYRLPATLCSEHGWKQTPIKPVFFAPTDILPGGLSEELQSRLKASRNLIVICSPNSAQSQWVGKEIEFFYQLGRIKQIHFFIVDGKPHSGNPKIECYNPIIDTLGLPEILGANIHEHIYRWPWMNKERAYVQLISKLLGVEFDTIWQRHKRLLINKAIAFLLGLVIVVAAIWGTWRVNQPIDVWVGLEEASAHNANLPPLKDAVICMLLDNETKSDTIRSFGDSAVFVNIPRKVLGKNARITINCKDFLDVDTLMQLKENMEIVIKRDPNVYGKVSFRLWDIDNECGIAKEEVLIEGQKVVADAEGFVCLFVPLESQRTSYHVKAYHLNIDDTLYMPCGENDVISTE